MYKVCVFRQRETKYICFYPIWCAECVNMTEWMIDDVRGIEKNEEHSAKTTIFWVRTEFFPLVTKATERMKEKNPKK